GRPAHLFEHHEPRTQQNNDLTTTTTPYHETRIPHPASRIGTSGDPPRPRTHVGGSPAVRILRSSVGVPGTSASPPSSRGQAVLGAAQTHGENRWPKSCDVPGQKSTDTSDARLRKPVSGLHSDPKTLISKLNVPSGL